MVAETQDHLYAARGAVTGADECLQGVAKKVDVAIGTPAASVDQLIAWAQAAALTAIAHALIARLDSQEAKGG